jgi:hypothetical protein
VSANDDGTSLDRGFVTGHPQPADH